MMAGTTAQVEQEGNLATTLSSFYPLAPSCTNLPQQIAKAIAK